MLATLVLVGCSLGIDRPVAQGDANTVTGSDGSMTDQGGVAPPDAGRTPGDAADERSDIVDFDNEDGGAEDAEADSSTDTRQNGRFDAGVVDAGVLLIGSTCSTTGGAPCAKGLQCVDDVCCNSSCSGECERCDLSGSVGTCTLAAAGTDCRRRLACEDFIAERVMAVSGVACFRYQAGNVRGTCDAAGSCVQPAQLCNDEGVPRHPMAIAQCDTACAQDAPGGCVRGAAVGQFSRADLCFTNTITADCNGPVCAPTGPQQLSAEGTLSCNSSGSCAMQQPSGCGGFSCAADGSACNTACDATLTCDTGYSCDMAASTCER